MNDTLGGFKYRDIIDKYDSKSNSTDLYSTRLKSDL